MKPATEEQEDVCDHTFLAALFMIAQQGMERSGKMPNDLVLVIQIMPISGTQMLTLDFFDVIHIYMVKQSRGTSYILLSARICNSSFT